MNIALDWDGTVTKDPVLWQRFVELANAAGHRVYILTKRYRSEPVSLEGIEEIIYCSRKAKCHKLNEIGIRIDIYIDNNPSDLFS